MSHNHNSPSELGLTSLHDVVVNYVTNAAFSSTARVLAAQARGRARFSPGSCGPSQTQVVKSSSKGNTSNGDGAGLGNGAGNGYADNDGEESMDLDEPAGEGLNTHEDEAGELFGRDRSHRGKVKEGDMSNGSKRTRSSGLSLEEDRLQAIERRRAILNHILDGAIVRAVEALNTHFPDVLADPVPSAATPTNGTQPSGNGVSNGYSHAQSQLHGYTFSPISAGPSGIGYDHGYGYAQGQPQVSGFAPTSNSTSISAILSYPARPFSVASTSASSTSFSNGGASASSGMSNHCVPVLFRSTYPSHVRLNLQIQQFIESFRQLSPSSPSTQSSPSSSIGSLANSGNLSNSTATLTHALTAAQGLHSEAKKLPAEIRAVYLQEIKDVGALFAYTDPENSILKGFLDQNRRIRLADQVNAAILRSQGESTQSTLEAFVRRTTLTYNLMNDHGVDARPPWTAADGNEKAQLAEYFKSRSGRPFDLREYINQSW